MKFEITLSLVPLPIAVKIETEGVLSQTDEEEVIARCNQLANIYGNHIIYTDSVLREKLERENLCIVPPHH